MHDRIAIFVYIHYFGSPHSRGILGQIFASILSSNLWERVERIQLVVTGDPLYFPSLKTLLTLYPKLQISINSLWSNGAEVQTLAMIRSQCQGFPADALVAYFHTKGAVNYTQINIDWLSYMIDYNIGCWPKAVNCLSCDGYDIYGASWCYADFSFDPSCTHLHGKRNGHYQGNFWWASCDYILKLDPPRDSCCRYEAETWIGLAEPRFYNAMCAPYSLTLASFTRSQYGEYHKHFSQDFVSVELPRPLIDRIKMLYPGQFSHDIDNLTFDENRAGISWSAASFDLASAIALMLELND